MRFYFDLQNGSGVIQDHEGAEAIDIDQAVEQAVEAIQEVRESEEVAPDGSWVLIIRDSDGAILKRIAI